MVYHVITNQLELVNNLAVANTSKPLALFHRITKNLIATLLCSGPLDVKVSNIWRVKKVFVRLRDVVANYFKLSYLDSQIFTLKNALSVYTPFEKL